MEFFFNPDSVAIVGASRNPMKFGSIILSNLINMEYAGRIFPVNPRGEDIAGIKTYTSVKEIPSDVDLVIFAIPAAGALGVMKDCAEKRVKGVVIISSGFKEAGEEGARNQRRLVEMARDAGIRIIGPNTTGILNPHENFTTTFVPLRDIRKGSVAFIAQTGMFAGMLLEWILSSECFGISKVAGLGNKCDINDADVLEYLAEDNHTSVIMMYMESIGDGRRFMEAAKATTRLKPIVALKAGRTDAGAAAAMSHTGSLAGNDSVTAGAFKQVGILRVKTFQRLIDFAKLFAYQPVARGNRLAIVSLSGGAGVMSTDAAVEAGFQLASFPRESLAEIQKHYPEWATIRHPFDIEPLTETVGFQPAFEMTTRCALKNPDTDACLVVTWTPFPETGFSFDFIHDLQVEYPDKPVVFCSIGYKDNYEILFQRLESLQIPVYSSFTRSIDALAASVEYGSYLKSIGATWPKHVWEPQGGNGDKQMPPKKGALQEHRAPKPEKGNKKGTDKLKIFFDGASKGNPGPAAIGAVLSEPSGKTILKLSERIGRATNNVAEYTALIRSLEEAKRLGATRVQCFSDSELLVRQMTGVYRVKSTSLMPLVQKAQSLRREFKDFSIQHVGRSHNQRADKLASDALK